jgi:hypothetical protein
MRSAIASALGLVLAVSVAVSLGCASGNDDEGTSGDASTDTGAHDSSLADTAFGDAPKDSTSDGPHDVGDGGAETSSEGGADSGSEAATDSAVTDSGVDAGSDGAADTSTDTHPDTAPDSVAIDSGTDTKIDSAIDSGTDTALDTRDAADVVVLGYRHTVVIDGTNDFTATSERFTTTSGAASGYFAYVTWDAANLYVGYEGADISGTTGTPGNKWVFAYLDTDPGAGTGATSGVTYNTETPTFPTGFGAEFYLRWKCDDTFSTLEMHGGAGWSTVAVSGVTHHRTGTYVEFSIPLATLGAPSKVGVVTLMMNETGGVEAAYAGIYVDNFTDGYHASVPIAHSLLGDFASPLSPNDPSNEK